MPARRVTPAGLTRAAAAAAALAMILAVATAMLAALGHDLSGFLVRPLSATP